MDKSPFMRAVGLQCHILRNPGEVSTACASSNNHIELKSQLWTSPILSVWELLENVVLENSPMNERPFVEVQDFSAEVPIYGWSRKS